MPKRAKHPRLPSGFGSIRYIGKRRNKPYAVHPPATERDPKTGEYIRPAALCYVSSWYVGFAVLSEYRSGTYTQGMEYKIESEFAAIDRPETELNDFILRIMHCASFAPDLSPNKPSLSDVYEQWKKWKFGEHAAQKRSKQLEAAYRSAFNLLQKFHDRSLDEVTLNEWQDHINSINMSSSTVTNTLSLIKQLYKFAIPRELCEKDTGAHIVMPSTRPQVHHEAFTESDLKTLWKRCSDPRAAMILVMCYSGFRVSAYKTLEINLTEDYFRGGVKTAAGKDRTVPIHSAIKPLIPICIRLLRRSPSKISADMTAVLTELSCSILTPHSTRHTFSTLCERYGVREADRKRMMGHSFGSDITNSVYGHRTLEELRTEIEKIQVPEH